MRYLITLAFCMAAVAGFTVEVGSMGQYVVVETIDMSRNTSAKPPPIRSVAACTAVDISMDAGDLCDTPGFTKKQVYPDGDADFEAYLWKKSRLLMRGRTVKQDWPLVYLQVTAEHGGKEVRRVVRLSRKVRTEAQRVETGRADQLNVLGPVTKNPLGGHQEHSAKALVLSVLGVILAAFLVAVVIKGRLRRAIRKAVLPRYDGQHYQLVLNHPPLPAPRKKPLSVRAMEALTGETRSVQQWEEAERQKRKDADRQWGVERGLLAPPAKPPNHT